MLLTISHVTEYLYSDPVSYAASAIAADAEIARGTDRIELEHTDFRWLGESGL